MNLAGIFYLFIYLLPKPITSLNGPFKIGPLMGQFRKVLLYMILYIHIAYSAQGPILHVLHILHILQTQLKTFLSRLTT